MANEKPDFFISQESAQSPVDALTGKKLKPDELEEAKENLASFLKLLVRIDQRTRNEQANAGY